MPRNSSHTHTKKQQPSKVTKAIFTIAIGLFVASLFFPAFLAQTHDINGYWVLLMGWMGFIAFQFAWYAAPLALLAIHLSTKSPQMGFFLSIVAILIASEAFLFNKVPLQESQQILGYGNGFYMWYASFYIVALGLLQNLIQAGNHNVTPASHTDVMANSGITLPESYSPPSTQQTRTAKKIISKKNEQVYLRPSINKSNIWKSNTQNPPPLPQKSINASVGKVATPPKLPTRKNVSVSTPPPLPAKPAILKTRPTPPPLPVKKAEKLKLPPFFSR